VSRHPTTELTQPRFLVRAGSTRVLDVAATVRGAAFAGDPEAHCRMTTHVHLAAVPRLGRQTTTKAKRSLSTVTKNTKRSARVLKCGTQEIRKRDTGVVERPVRRRRVAFLPESARNVGYNAWGSRDCSCNAGVSPAVPRSASPQEFVEEMPARGQRYGAREQWVSQHQAFRYVRICVSSCLCAFVVRFQVSLAKLLRASWRIQTRREVAG
jgi:hypothetical protein